MHKARIKVFCCLKRQKVCSLFDILHVQIFIQQNIGGHANFVKMIKNADAHLQLFFKKKVAGGERVNSL